MAKVGEMIYQAVLDDPDLTEEEAQELHPGNPKYTSLKSYVQAVKQITGQKLSQKELAALKEAAVTEAEARITSKQAATRTSQPSPPVLPSGTPAQSDADFIRAYANGESDDHARYQKIRQNRGI
jgi:hypothetical protein